MSESVLKNLKNRLRRTKTDTEARILTKALIVREETGKRVWYDIDEFIGDVGWYEGSKFSKSLSVLVKKGKLILINPRIHSKGGKHYLEVSIGLSIKAYVESK